MIILYILFFLFGVCYGETWPHLRQYPPYYELFEPCPQLTENCIRSFFQTHSKCRPVYADIPDVLYDMNKMVFPIPHANFSFVWDAPPTVRGLNDGRIITFYVNRRTRNIVLEIEFDDITLYSAHASRKYYFRGREPVIHSGFFGISHKKMSVTATIPVDSYSGIQWDKKDIFSYFGDPELSALVDAALCGSEPEVQAACQVWRENSALNAKEAGVVNGPIFFNHFIEDRICKF